ncbi:MAG: thioredoxin family protein [Erysipelotrichaceae bacterium]
MKKLGIVLILLVGLVGCNKQPAQMEMDDFTHLSFAQLQEKIDAKETMVVYFGWVTLCGDAINFQNNYLLPETAKNSSMASIYVVDLDVELPEGLQDKTLREGMKAQFGVQYSPTLIAYENGEVQSLLEWTPATTDATYAIPKTALDAFFSNIKS